MKIEVGISTLLHSAKSILTVNLQKLATWS